MDQMVFKTQLWLNGNYKDKHGYNLIDLNDVKGQTGWATVNALTRALQIELGIDEPSDSFGPTTMRLFKPLSINSNPTNSNTEAEIISMQNQIYILQGALWCKGFSPGGFTGYFGNGTKDAIINFQSAAGLSNGDGVVTSTIMRALLSMDAFNLLEYGDYNGDDTIRQMQQYLNKNYSSNKYFNEDLGLIPCDGIYGKKANSALIYALQIELGISEPTGYFGPATRGNCPYLTFGTENTFVKLLQYSLYCNGTEFNPTGFTGYYGNGTQNAVLAFQKFTCLSTSGNAGMQTWSSLLTSTGDPEREGTACDCITIITEKTAKTLVANGRKFVGRYLTGKFKMSPNEFETIINYGLNLIPIFEVYGYYAEWFTSENGRNDANSALLAAKTNGIPEGSIIYFAADYDVSGYELTNNIIPYFKAINEAFSKSTVNYKIGIYAPRYVCTYLGEKGYTCSSFVCDMSTGFACNIGYSLPKDWAFDQISTVTIGSDSGIINIDNNISSGKYLGCDSINKSIDKNELMLLQVNNNPLNNILKVNFNDFEKELELLSTGMLKIKAKASATPQLGSGDFTFSVKDGQITSGGTGLESAIGTLGISLSKNSMATISSQLLKMGNFNATASLSVTLTKVSLSIEVKDSQKVFDNTISTSLRVTIEISLFDDNSSSELDSILATAKDLSDLILFLILGICIGIVLVYGSVEVAVIACISLLLTKVASLFIDNDNQV